MNLLPHLLLASLAILPVVLSLKAGECEVCVSVLDRYFQTNSLTLRYSQIVHECCSPAFVSNENRKYLLKIETLNKSFLSQVPGDSS